jgi:hypothetical protein
MLASLPKEITEVRQIADANARIHFSDGFYHGKTYCLYYICI